MRQDSMLQGVDDRLMVEMEGVGRSAALAAGERIRAHMGAPSSVGTKGVSDYVTDVDRACEEIILEAIGRAFPEHHVISEETPFSEWKPGITWIVDPLDGTTNFIHGYPMVSVSIGVALDGEVILGLVLDPLRQELFTAQEEKGTYLNGERIRVRENASLDDALVATGFPHRIKDYLDPYLEAFRGMLQRLYDARRGGSAALDLAYVACGRLDGFWEPGLKPWDVAAGSLLVREAGGLVSDFWGADRYLRNGHIVAGTPRVHPFLLQQVKAHLAPVLKDSL
jgi:myo-inositol-1(or 4)-monophosphatase